MRGNSDVDNLYPLSVVPAAGWGNDNPTGEYALAFVPRIGAFIKEGEDDTYEIVTDSKEATRYATAADAAVAGGRLKQAAIERRAEAA